MLNRHWALTQVAEIHAAAELTHDRYKDDRTCGVLNGDILSGDGIISGGGAAAALVAEPVGVVACVLSAADPCAFAISLALLALKTGNALVLCAHPSAPMSAAAVARCVRDAAAAAGAPVGLVQWVRRPSSALAKALMRDARIGLVVASGALTHSMRRLSPCAAQRRERASE